MNYILKRNYFDKILARNKHCAAYASRIRLLSLKMSIYLPLCKVLRWKSIDVISKLFDLN